MRKTSQAALLVLMEQGLISNGMSLTTSLPPVAPPASTQKHVFAFLLAGNVEEHICPVICELTKPEAVDDFRTEAVAVSATQCFASFPGILYLL